MSFKYRQFSDSIDNEGFGQKHLWSSVVGISKYQETALKYGSKIWTKVKFDSSWWYFLGAGAPSSE